MNGEILGGIFTEPASGKSISTASESTASLDFAFNSCRCDTVGYRAGLSIERHTNTMT
jgi:hypothetical protein